MPQASDDGRGRKQEEPVPRQETGGGRRRKPDAIAGQDSGTGWMILNADSPAVDGAHTREAKANGSHARSEYTDTGRTAGQPSGVAGPVADEPTGAHTKGRSVSELLAAYGDSSDSGRRRRRDED